MRVVPAACALLALAACAHAWSLFPDRLLRPGAAGERRAGYSAQAELDAVHHLPGWGKPAHGLFSGYVTVNETAGRALFYVFAEAAEAASLPLVLWLNGGPGCSSLAGGFLSELGPYYPTNQPGRLQRNDFTWTQAANIIFLESPAFVGWSYSNTSADAVVGDARTAADTYVFLEKFVERFPAYAGRELWVAGESYGGHYVPNLALEIVRRQRGARGGPRRLNLQGFLVGNAWTDAAVDNGGAVDFWWSHAMISDETRAGAHKTCNFSSIGPLRGEHGLDVDAKACAKYVARATEEMGPINIYEIYADVCRDWRADADGRQLLRALAGPDAVLRQGQYDPCIDNEVQAYFNRPDVQAALHANRSQHALPYGPWQGCSTIVKYSQDDLFSSMLPVYRELLAAEPRLAMLVFSGDVDGIVPVLGTRRWIRALELPIAAPWRPWTSATGQVGGYVERYRGLTFATVRNAGHMVPYTQAERSYYLFSRWLNAAHSDASADLF